MCVAREAAAHGDIQRGQVGLMEQGACAIEAQVRIVAARRAIEMLLEEAFQLSRGDARPRRDFRDRHRRLHGLFHRADRDHELGVTKLQPVSQGAALVAVVLPQPRVDELLRDLEGEMRSVFQRDHMQQHVQPGRRPAAGETLAVDLIEVRCRLDLRKFLREAVQFCQWIVAR